jgi:hypothetical protein
MPSKSLTPELASLASTAALTETAEPAVEPPPPAPAPAPPETEPDETEADDAAEQEAEGPHSAEAAGLDVIGLMHHFSEMMAQRDRQLWAQLEERLAAIVPPAVNGHVRPDNPELAAPYGQYPSHLTTPLAAEAPAPAPRKAKRMVAFIPKEDPYNPRSKTFQVIHNGRVIRAKRGQVMILTLGHGISLAKKGHGNCVDIAAMQGQYSVTEPINVTVNPDFARPDSWDGLPMTRESSFSLR